MLCKIGEVEVWRILEIHAPFRLPEELYPTAGPDVAKIIESHVPGGLCPETGKLILPVQGFLLKTPSHLILVDSCVGNDKTNPNTPDWHQRNSPRFEAALTAAGVGFEDVDYVLCTHLHTDHVGWNTRKVDGRWVPTFPNAKYLMPQADKEMHESRNSDIYLESILPIVEAGQAEWVGSDFTFCEEVHLVPTPGHSPGHVSVRIESGGASALITGDALHSTAQCWHPEWHFTFDADPVKAAVSRSALLASAADLDCLVLGNHFALPSLGRVRATDTAFAWEPVR